MHAWTIYERYSSRCPSYNNVLFGMYPFRDTFTQKGRGEVSETRWRLTRMVGIQFRSNYMIHFLSFASWGVKHAVQMAEGYNDNKFLRATKCRMKSYLHRQRYQSWYHGQFILVVSGFKVYPANVTVAIREYENIFKKCVHAYTF